MKVLEYSKRRVLAALDTIEEIRASEFPYPDPEKALHEIEQKFRTLLESLELAVDEDSASGVSAISALLS